MLGYVKIGDIEGMATQEGHEKWIPIDAMFHGASRNVADGSNDPVADLRNSRVQVGGIQFTKNLDSSSPKLLEAVCNGTVFPKITIELCRNTEGRGDMTYLVYTMENAFIKSYDANSSAAAGGHAASHENVAIGFSKVKVSYKVVDEKGKVTGSVDTGWDLLKSRTA